MTTPVHPARPSLEVTPEGQAYNRETSTKIFIFLGVFLAILSGAMLSTSDAISWKAVGSELGRWMSLLLQGLVSVEVFVTSQHLHLGVIVGLGLYALVSELIAANLIAGLTAKEVVGLPDVQAAVQAVHTNRVLRHYLGIFYASFGLLSVFAFFPKVISGSSLDMGLTVLSMVLGVGVGLALHAPMLTVLLPKKLRDTVSRDMVTRQMACRNLKFTRWAEEQVGLVEYAPFFCYQLAEKFGSFRTITAYAKDDAVSYWHWRLDFNSLSANEATSTVATEPTTTEVP